MRVVVLTLLAMIAFAGNSLLCRMALKRTSIDPATFTVVRILSGAVALWLISTCRKGQRSWGGDWPSALALVVYAASFSFAYVSLSAATGALLLFGAVQATMVLAGLRRGERLLPLQMIGVAVTLAGLVILLFPGLSAPPLVSSVLMLSAGIGWGIYSLRGRGAVEPIHTTTGNFLRAVPLIAVIGGAFVPWVRFDATGITYAVISGAIASGIGYVIWYMALPNLEAITAATVQLGVPVLAAAGGILLLREPFSLRFLVAALAVLGGIALVVLRPSSRAF